jgi:hypothetical protein
MKTAVTMLMKSDADSATMQPGRQVMSPAAIAAAVRKPNRLIVAERLLAAKRAERAAFVESIGTALEAAGQNYGTARKLEAERLDLEEQIKTLRREVLPMREKHVAAVREALRDEEAAAGTAMLDALAAIREAQARRQAIVDAIHEAGNPLLTIPGLPRGLGEIEIDARRAAEKAQ